MSEQGVQEGAVHGCVEDSVADIVTYNYHLGAACQEVQDPVAEGDVYPRVLILVMSLEGTVVC